MRKFIIPSALRAWLCFSLLLAIVCFQTGCGQSNASPNAPTPKPPPPLIRTIGIFSLNGGSDQISINEIPAEALGFQIGEGTDFDRLGVGIIADPRKPWFFHNATDGSVWSYTDDLGIMKWTFDPGKGWRSMTHEDMPEDVRESMPPVFREALPEGLP